MSAKIEGSNTCIGIIVAMMGEAKGLIQALELKKENFSYEHLPFEYYSGNFSGKKVILSINGINKRYGVDNIGTCPASLAAMKLIDKYNPNIIINAGTAGGFESQNGLIGDVYISQGKVLFHDHVISLKTFTDFGTGYFPCSELDGALERLPYKRGVISSGDSLEPHAHELEFFKKHKVAAKEMEAAAIAWVCEMFEKPFVAVKAITDLVDHHETSASQFMKNFQLATKNLKNAVESLLKTI